MYVIKRELLKGVGSNKISENNINRNKFTLSESDKVKHNTQKIIADELGWSTGKVAMADIIMSKAPEAWSKVKTGDIIPKNHLVILR